jgi:hypothetical protein
MAYAVLAAVDRRIDGAAQSIAGSGAVHGTSGALIALAARPPAARYINRR